MDGCWLVWLRNKIIDHIIIDVDDDDDVEEILHVVVAVVIELASFIQQETNALRVEPSHISSLLCFVTLFFRMPETQHQREEINNYCIIVKSQRCFHCFGKSSLSFFSVLLETYHGRVKFNEWDVFSSRRSISSWLLLEVD
jgi:hypothetical protein